MDKTTETTLALPDGKHVSHILIADDLTGGNDSGIQFAQSGLEASMLVTPTMLSAENLVCSPVVPGHGPDILVLNTDTRNVQVDDVPQRIRDCLNFLCVTGKPDSGSIVFKKIDSTLRGNLGVEMDVIMDALGFDLVFFAPSYPQQGRTVRDGNLLVHGSPVHQTEFAHDPLSPVRDAFIPRLLAAQSRRKSGIIPLNIVEAGSEVLNASISTLRDEGCSVIIFNAEEQNHLEAIAVAGLAQPVLPLFMGSAGLAKGLADCLAQAPAATASETKETRTFSPQGKSDGRKVVLFVCGSVSQVTRTQVKKLESTPGVSLFLLPEGELDAAKEDALARSIIQKLDNGPSILATPALAYPQGEMCWQEDVTSSLSLVAERILENIAAGPENVILFLTGGDTALAVLKKLGIIELRLKKELTPGIVLTQVMGGRFNGMAVITKAGGFGEPDALHSLLSLV